MLRVTSYNSTELSCDHVQVIELLFVGVDALGIGVLGGVVFTKTICVPATLLLPTESIAFTLISCDPFGRWFAVKEAELWFG